MGYSKHTWEVLLYSWWSSTFYLNTGGQMKETRLPLQTHCLKMPSGKVHSAISSPLWGLCLYFLQAVASWQLYIGRQGCTHISFPWEWPTCWVRESCSSSPPKLSESKNAWTSSLKSRVDTASLCSCLSLAGPVSHRPFPCKPHEKGETSLPWDSYTHQLLFSLLYWLTG